MTATLRRGACPSLAAPMLTGDGWLVRLALPDGLTPGQLAGLADAAARRGNGLVEVTARGSVQVRGLTEASAEALAGDLGALGMAVAAGLPVLTGALAGLDPGEAADPRPLAAELRRRSAAAGLDRRLHPKVSVVVDGGGALSLEGIAADVRLRAVAQGWEVSVGGRTLGTGDPDRAVAAAFDALEDLAVAGARAREGATRPVPIPVGRFALAGGRVARGLGLPFGQAEAANLSALAAVAGGAARLRPAPGRALVAVGLEAGADAVLAEGAGPLGFVVDARDPRLAVVACAGAPACASAHLATRALAGRIAELRPALPDGVRLHLSGCPKRCAQPAGPVVTLLATPEGRVVTGECRDVPPSLRSFLLGVAAP